MTVAAVAARDPVDLPRASSLPGLPLGPLSARGPRPARDWLEPVFEQGEALLGRARGVVPALRHRRRADPRQRRGRRRSAWSLAWRLFGVELGRLRWPAKPERVRALQRPRPVPLPRLAEQVVVRRPQPPAVHRHRRPGRGVPVVVRPAGRSTTPSTTSATVTVGAGRGLRRVQTGRVQNYALGIALGLIVMAGSFLVIAGR